MKDVNLLPAAIALAVREEREETEEGESEEAEEGDENEVKCVYPTAHREFVERMKEIQGKLEEAMAPLNVEALGLSRLRFVKVETEADKLHSVGPEVCSTSPSYSIQQEISEEQKRKQQMDH
eukprot:MONOS_296.1-p1 / transcript=MONOS_296.1 / gene=MONOS_296 / organism=Monocercomonoides_exilis_PA203 / gene_product=unspecified product / transcript_product=unspecified product / location=Mono_scaffold00005:56407-56772(+) / protein_length=122 / sequence_SO=supercontig / SO=protein_coding / is_pseudo=false